MSQLLMLRKWNELIIFGVKEDAQVVRIFKKIYNSLEIEGVLVGS